MFLQNKYTKWYFNIVDKAISQRDIIGYTEIHHIIPKSMGGNNTKDNLVVLTAREHFICHLLLVKAVDASYKKKMNFAFWRMCNIKENRHTPTARQYLLGKSLFTDSQLGHAPYLLSHTKETRDKISKIMSSNLLALSADEKRARMLNSCCKPGSYTDERIDNMRKGMIGKKKTKTVALLAAEEARRNRTTEEKLKCGALHKGKTWKIIDGKRTWFTKENENY